MVGKSEMTPFNSNQRAEVLVLVERLPWADIDCAIRGMEVALRLALEATTDDFWRWEDEIGPDLEAYGYDEFTVPAERIEHMSADEKFAYIARLLRTLAISYGVSAEFGGAQTGLVGEADESSPAALIRGLNDISWMPTQALKPDSSAGSPSASAEA
jgi:hypothetical protein